MLYFILMAISWKSIFGIKEVKAVPSGVAFSDTEPRGAIDKAHFPNFLVRPPFGWPKLKDVNTIRRLASTPAAAMIINAIIDETVSTPWDIVPLEKDTEESSVTQAHIDQVKMFFDNPNTSKESFDHIQRLLIRDILELDGGVIVKEFNASEEMVEMKSVDSAGFLKNPDIYNKIQNRDDLIIESFVDTQFTTFGQAAESRTSTTFEVVNTPRAGGLSVADAKTRAAYFQFGYSTGAKAIPFGKREVVWMEQHPLNWDLYGRSPVENILDVLQTLIHSIRYNLEYFEDNNVPKGIINLPGADEKDINDFRDKWNDLQIRVDPISRRFSKIFHRVPIVNSPNLKFERIQFSAQELELIASQAWFSKLVWMMFGASPGDVGFTDDSNRATEVVADRRFKRKTILPLLKILEYHINKEIVSEFEFDDIEFKFTLFDVEGETKKYELYQLQTATKIRTINEVRKDEGMPEVEWGDGPQSMMDSMGLDPVQQFEKPKTADDGENLGRDKEAKALTVAQTTGNVTLGENEVLASMRKLLRKEEKELIDLIRKEAKKDRLSEIKSIDQIAERIAGLFSLEISRPVIEKAVRDLYEKGWKKSQNTLEEAEAQPVDFRPVAPNKEQIKYIQNMTFDNIRGMDEATKGKLTQALRIAVIEGQGVGKVVENIKDIFDATETRAEAIARTELNRAENQGQLQSMKTSDREILKYLLITHDKRTSQISKAMDRKYGTKEQAIGLNENFKVTVSGKAISKPAPPFHVNERDVLLFDVQPRKKDGV